MRRLDRRYGRAQVRGLTMALYEVVREIGNSCSGNQMRDVFFDEIETDDPLAFVRAKLSGDPNAVLTLQARDENNCTVYAECKGITQRFVFTKI